MAIEDPFSCFLKNRDEIVTWLFWVERFPTILVPLVSLFLPENLFYVYLICIPILIFTSSIYFGYNIHEIDNYNLSSHHGKEMLLAEEVELCTFVLERISVACLMFSCFSYPFAGHITYAFILASATFFTITNLVYLGCNFFEIVSQTGLDSRTHNGQLSMHENENLQRRLLDENLDGVMDSDAIDKDEVEDSEDIELPLLEEYAEAKEDGVSEKLQTVVEKLEMMMNQFRENTELLLDIVKKLKEMEKRWKEKLMKIVKKHEDDCKKWRTQLVQTYENGVKNWESQEIQLKQMVKAFENCRIKRGSRDKQWKEMVRTYEVDRQQWKEIVKTYEDDRKNREKEKQNHNSQIRAATETYENDRENWEKEKQDLNSRIRAATETYENDRKNWEKEKQNLDSQISAKYEKYEYLCSHYNALHNKQEEDRIKWEDEKNDLIQKLSATEALCENYKSLLHDSYIYVDN